MIITILILLGLCFGSFVNALVWRLYEQDLPKKKRVANDKELSITKGRSMCPHCQHTLAWYDLLPVVSWLSLQGKCRYCHKPISWQYPLVETSTALLFVCSYLWWPLDLDRQGIWLLAVWLLSLVALVALTIYDIRWMLLPNRIVFPLIAIATIGVLGNTILSNHGLHVLLRALGGLAVAGGIFYVLFQVSNGKWIGGGDVKIGFALGLLLGGPIEAFLMLFLASLLGLVVSLPALFTKKTQLSGKIPFGPFLIAATIITVLFGSSLIDWYTQTFLYL
jgi:prepilin signal peptidase PulO-like enzyme (type II secretory pathway)